MDRALLTTVAITSALFALLAGCASTGPALRGRPLVPSVVISRRVRNSLSHLPIYVRTESLSIGIQQRTLGEGRIALTITIFPRKYLSSLRIHLSSGSRNLHLDYTCTFDSLHLPPVPRAQGTAHPNALPALPSCTAIATATDPGSYQFSATLKTGHGRIVHRAIKGLLLLP